MYFVNVFILNNRLNAKFIPMREDLDKIDIELNDIDKNIPDEVLEEDEETDELIKANKMLREKVGTVLNLVVSAVEKADAIRRQIITHRDKPDDPELNSKLKKINNYQKAIMKMKYPIVSSNYRAKEMQDEITDLVSEIEKLEQERDNHK
jgi:uncharacterized coiled-coil DUF342 family protein